jgi:ribosome-binding ATPase
MPLTCGMVGLTGCGKTTIFNALTAAGAGIFDGAETHIATVTVPDSRLQALAKIYNPAKIIAATMQLVDIPGLKSDNPGRQSRLIGHIKDADTLLHVVRCFNNGQEMSPVRDVETLDIEMLAADSQTVQNKIDRIIKKAKSGEKESVRQLADCEKIKKALEEGIPARRQGLDEKELDTIRECNLLSVKAVLYIGNCGSAEDAAGEPVKKLQEFAAADGSEVVIVYGKDEAEISQLDPSDRQEFLNALGLKESSMARLLQAAYRKLGLVTFFTVGADEVRAWTCRKGDKAPTAAGKIHSDFEKRFIRMEVMSAPDVLELGGEAAVIQAGKKHTEGRSYEVQEGDVVVVLFN